MMWIVTPQNTIAKVSSNCSNLCPKARTVNQTCPRRENQKQNWTEPQVQGSVQQFKVRTEVLDQTLASLNLRGFNGGATGFNKSKPQVLSMTVCAEVLTTILLQIGKGRPKIIGAQRPGTMIACTNLEIRTTNHTRSIGCDIHSRITQHP